MKTVYRVNDRVKIINPDFFVRVGYPWTVEYGVNTLVTSEEKEKIKELIGINNIDREYLLFEYENIFKVNLFDKIVEELARYKIRAGGFGGKERSIYTEKIEEFKGKIVRVTSKKVVKTGSYNHGSWHEDDYCPAYLSNEKSHVLLEVYTSSGHRFIEENNVELVKETINNEN